MDHTNAALFQNRDVTSLWPNHVRRDHPLIQKTDPLEISNRTRALSLDAVVNLTLRLGNMSNDRRAGAIGKRACRFEMIFRNRVRRVRRNRGNDQLVTFPTSDKLLDVRHAFRVCLIVGDWKIDDRLAEHTANACFRSFVGDRVFEVIHVAVGRRATANHFGQSEARPDANKLFRDVLCFRRKDVLRQPLLQIEIVGETTKQDHRNVRVAVDQTRRDDLARRVNPLA